MRTIRWSARLAVRLIPFLACLTLVTWSYAQQALRGQIIRPDGRSWSHEVRFMIVSSDGSLQQYYFTDSKGSFIVPNLRLGKTYTLIVDSDGVSYEAARETFNLENLYYLNVFLKPLSRSKKKPEGGTVSASGLAPDVPADVRRSYEDGVSRARAGKLEDSIGHFERAIEKSPGYYEAVNDLGVVYLKLNRFPEAEKMLRRAAELRPEEFRPLLNLGIVLFRSSRFEEAAKVLTRCLEIQKGLPEAERYLGEALLEQGKLDEAEKHLASVLETRDDNRPYAMIKLAIVKIQKNDNASAIHLLERYLAEYPKASNRSEIERILNEIRQ